MSIPWPSERISRVGLLEFVIACAAFLAGVTLSHRGFLHYLPPERYTHVFMLSGLVGLIVCGVMLFRIARRREYPWIVAFGAVALPFYAPGIAPYASVDRVVMAIRDLALTAAIIVFVRRILRASDELERRIHLEAVTWAFTVVLVALIVYASAEDVLPALRGPWVASAMLAAWAAAWIRASWRYQR